MARRDRSPPEAAYRAADRSFCCASGRRPFTHPHALRARPVAGVLVYWAIIEGSGSVTPADPTYALTDANGYATASWVLGAGSNQLRAAVYHPTHLYTIFTATGGTP